jgi:short-subunit dehydrogenase
LSEALAGKLALVTGASRGIGAATAEALAAAGAHVVLTARTVAGLEAVEERIHDAGGSATIAPLDLADGDSINRLAEAISGRWKALDVLVLNAAMLGTLSPVPHIDAKEFAKVVTLNLTAQAALIGAFDSMLRASGGAQVIGMTSSVGAVPRAYWGAYGASKAGFETLLGAYAEETRNIGRVRVAIVDPGATRTAMRARAFPGEDPATVKAPEDVASRIAALTTDGFETGYRERIN